MIDIIFIAALVVGLVLGLIKGFLKPLLSAIGLIIIAFGSSALTPVVQGWLMGVDMDDSLRPMFALIATIIGLSVVWMLVSLIIRKIITARRGVGFLNRVIGAAIGVIIVYLSFAVVIAFIVNLGGLVPFVRDMLGPEVEKSWIRANIYSDSANFFGNWIVQDMARRILDIMQQQNPEALVGVISVVI